MFKLPYPAAMFILTTALFPSTDEYDHFSRGLRSRSSGNINGVVFSEAPGACALLVSIMNQ